MTLMIGEVHVLHSQMFQTDPVAHLAVTELSRSGVNSKL